MPIFHTDNPISGGPNSPDELNRTNFSQRIGDALKIRSDSKSLVASLEGPWGFGKTSVIYLIENYYKTLKGNERPIVYYFNPWMIGSSQNLVQEFIVQFGSCVGLSSKAKNAQDASKQLLAYSKVFNVLKWVPGAEPWASLIGKILEGAGTATQKISELKDLDINQKRLSVVAALKKIKRPIVVFIDDIDRLPPNEVFQMIRTVKAIADFPGTTFLLAFERTYVEKSLKKYGIDDSSLYLDKIIQVRLHLPLISDDDLHSMAISELNSLSDIELTSFFEGDQQRLSEVYNFFIRHLIKTPRELKRVFNRLRFIEPSVQKNVCFSDLFALEVIAIKAPHIYEHIRTCPWAYNGKRQEINFDFDEPKKIIERYQKDREEALSSVPKEDRIYISELISKLFPLLSSSFSEGSGNIDYHYSKGHIASPDRLRFALSFGLPSGEISSNIISDFLTSPDDREKIIESFLETEKLERFVDLLFKYVKYSKPLDPSNFAFHIANITESHPVKKLQEKSRDILKAGPIRKLWWIAEFTLEKLSNDERSKILIELSHYTNSITLPTYALHFCLNQHGFFENGTLVPEKERWLDVPQLKTYQANWIESVTKTIHQESFFNISDPTIVLLTLKRIEPQKTKDIISPLLNQENYFEKFVRAMGKASGTDSTKGEYAELSEELLASFGDVEMIKQLAQKGLESNDVDTELRAIYNSVLTGNAYYLTDNTPKPKVY